MGILEIVSPEKPDSLMRSLISSEWLLGAWHGFSGHIWARWERVSDGKQEDEEGGGGAVSAIFLL